MHLARHYLYRGDFARCQKLANFCLTSLREGSKSLKDTIMLRSELHNLIGQCHHAQGDFEGAFRQYSSGCKLNDKNPQIQFLLG
jgi:hypothetical protein